MCSEIDFQKFVEKIRIMKKLLPILVSFVCLTCSTSTAQTWTQIPSGTTKDLKTISFPSNNVGYIGGQDSIMLKTTDGGQTWSPINFTGVTFFPNGSSIVDLKFVSELVGYMVVGPYTGTYKTVDGGLTWTEINTLYACFNSSLYFFDENNGFLGGAGCFSGEIINKLSGTWSETNLNPLFIQQNGIITGFDFFDTNLGIASSSGDYFFKTSNGGNVWDTIPNGLEPEDSMTSVLFLNADTILATNTSSNIGFGVNVSFDGGLTWQPESNSATFFYPNMFATHKTDNGKVFVAGQQSQDIFGTYPGLIYESNSSIQNWSFESVDQGIRDMDSYGDSVVFAVGKNGYIIVNQDLSQLGNKKIEEEIQFEIFPNPNHGEFTIRIGENQIDQIEITNLIGNKIYASSNFSTNNLIQLQNASAGVYFVTLKTKGRFVSRKIVLE